VIGFRNLTEATVIPTYLVKNPLGIWHFRRFVPKDLKLFVGKAVLRKTCRTRDYRDALTVARQYAVDTDLFFQKLRIEEHGLEKDSWLTSATRVRSEPERSSKLEALHSESIKISTNPRRARISPLFSEIAEKYLQHLTDKNPAKPPAATTLKPSESPLLRRKHIPITIIRLLGKVRMKLLRMIRQLIQS